MSPSEHLLVCEFIGNHKQVDPGQARPGAEVSDLHPFVRVPARFHKDTQPPGLDRNQASDFRPCSVTQETPKKDELGLVEHETGPVGLQRGRHHGVEKDLLNQHFVA